MTTITYSNIEKEMHKAAKANKATVTEICWSTAETASVFLNNNKSAFIVLAFFNEEWQGCYVQVDRDVELLDEDTDEPTGEIIHEDFYIDCQSLGEAVRKWRVA